MLTIADSLREEGRLEAKLEGRLEGKREGRLESKQEFAKALLADQQPIDCIVKWTGLTPQQVQALAEQNKH